MNKGDLIEMVASRLGESKAQSSRLIDTVLSCIADGVNTDGKVTISGFGSFEKKHRAARIGVNPVTKERINIEPSITVGFRPSPLLKDIVGEVQDSVVSES